MPKNDQVETTSPSFHYYYKQAMYLHVILQKNIANQSDIKFIVAVRVGARVRIAV
jgi:hypothetical protein